MDWNLNTSLELHIIFSTKYIALSLKHGGLREISTRLLLYRYLFGFDFTVQFPDLHVYNLAYMLHTQLYYNDL